MLFSSFGKRLSRSESAAAPAKPRRRRRGATAMEYLFVISLIIVVAITGINYFAQNVKENLQHSHDAIQKAQDGNKSSTP